MSYTFGANAGDDINFTGGYSLNADNATCLVAGWFYPTTLTAGRRYWSAGPVFGAVVDATTSEMQLLVDGTTDSVWTTSGAGIVTDKWQFIAFLSSIEVTGTVDEWRVWVGDESTPPAEVSLNHTTLRSGLSGSSTAYTLGNAGSTGVVAFQGDIFSVSFTACTAGQGPLFVETGGTISQAAADRILRDLVMPIWEGRATTLAVTPGMTSSNYATEAFDLASPTGIMVHRNRAVGSQELAAIFNGVTYTGNRPGRCPLNACWPSWGYPPRR